MSIEKPSGQTTPAAEGEEFSGKPIALREPAQSEIDPTDVFSSNTSPNVEAANNNEAPVDVKESGVERGPGAYIDNGEGAIPPEKPIPAAFEVPPNLSSDSKKFFESLSTSAKSLFNSISEKTGKIEAPEFVNKYRIAKNNEWVLQNQQKAAELKLSIDTLERQITTYTNSQQEFEALAAQMEHDGTPGVEDIRLQIAQNETNKNALAQQREALAPELLKRQQKVEIYTEHRDAIANRLNEKYEAKITPLLDELGKLESAGDTLSHLEIAMHVRHKSVSKKLEGYAATRELLTEQFKALGWDEQTIAAHGTMQAIDTAIQKETAQMQSDKLEMTTKKAEHDQKVLAVENKVTEHESKKFIFAEHTVPTATESDKGTQKTPDAIPTNFSGARSVSSFESRSIETALNKKTETFLNAWNEYVAESDGDIPEDRKVSVENFSNRAELSSEELIDFDDFKDLMISHLRLDKISFDETALRGTFEQFLEDGLNK